jgi:hypothetical protein
MRLPLRRVQPYIFKVYLWDTFRMFSQPNETQPLRHVLCVWLASHAANVAVLETALLGNQQPCCNEAEVNISADDRASNSASGRLNQQYNAMASSTARFLDSPWAQLLLQAGIVAWLGLGPSQDWSGNSG